MANGYAAEEALGFCTEYLNLEAYTKRRVWDTEEDKGMHSCIVEGRGRLLTVSEEEVARAHNYVVLHDERTAELRRYGILGLCKSHNLCTCQLSCPQHACSDDVPGGQQLVCALCRAVCAAHVGNGSLASI